MPRDGAGARDRAPRRWSLGAALLAALGVLATEAWLFGPVWSTGPRLAIPSPISQESGRASDGALGDALREGDHLFAVWAVGRNASTLSSEPTRLFDAESCHPVENALALGEPMIAMGLLAMPAWLATGDPVASYNFSLAAMLAIGALAMFALVWRWTGDPVAGMTAGILYGFGEVKLRELVHPYAYDTAWTLLALLFVREWLRAGRWRDALAAALCCGMQMTASFYPLLAATVMALPVGVWLLFHHGVSRPTLAQATAAGAVLLAFALWIYGPFLEIRSGGAVAHAQGSLPYYGIWSTFLPGGWNFPGWLALILAGAGLAFGGRHPRFALLAGALLVAFLGAGGNAMAQRWGAPPVALPNPYQWLARIVPGLDQVRAPAALFVGVHWAVCLLAGLGAAALLARVSGSRARIAGGALVALTWAATLQPAWLGFEPPFEVRSLRVRPPEDTLRLAASLARRDDDGALVEVPLGEKELRARSAAILMTLWHRRRTSVCHGSQRPEQIDRVERIAARLPEPAALSELRDLGFSTVLVHHSRRRPAGGPFAARFEEAARGAAPRLRRLNGTRLITAYSIEPDPP